MCTRGGPLTDGVDPGFLSPRRAEASHRGPPRLAAMRRAPNFPAARQSCAAHALARGASALPVSSACTSFAFQSFTTSSGFFPVLAEPSTKVLRSSAAHGGLLMSALCGRGGWAGGGRWCVHLRVCAHAFCMHDCGGAFCMHAAPVARKVAGCTRMGGTV